MAGYIKGKFLKQGDVNGDRLTDTTVADGKMIETYLKQSEVDDTSLEFTTDLHIKDGGVTSAKIAENAVGATELNEAGNYNITGTLQYNGKEVATADQINGLRGKQSVICISDSDIALSGVPANVDGVTDLADGNRILLIDQTDGTENGIWEVRTGSWTRPADFPTGGDAAAAYCWVQRGDTYVEQGWRCTDDTGSAIIDTDALTFTQWNGAGGLTGGSCINITGNKISADLTVDGGLEASDGTDNATIQVKASATTGGLTKDSTGVRVKGTASVSMPTGGGDLLKIHQTNTDEATGQRIGLRVQTDGSSNKNDIAILGICTDEDAAAAVVGYNSALEAWGNLADKNGVGGTFGRAGVGLVDIVDSSKLITAKNSDDYVVMDLGNGTMTLRDATSGENVTIELDGPNGNLKLGGEITNLAGSGEAAIKFVPGDSGLTSDDTNDAIREVKGLVDNAVGEILDGVLIDGTAYSNGYVDLGFTNDPSSPRVVRVNPDGGVPLNNHARIGSTGANYHFRMGDTNKKRLYFRNVSGVGGDFAGGASGVTEVLSTNDVIFAEVLA